MTVTPDFPGGPPRPGTPLVPAKPCGPGRPGKPEEIKAKLVVKLCYDFNRCALMCIDALKDKEK